MSYVNVKNPHEELRELQRWLEAYQLRDKGGSPEPKVVAVLDTDEEEE